MELTNIQTAVFALFLLVGAVSGAIFVTRAEKSFESFLNRVLFVVAAVGLGLAVGVNSYAIGHSDGWRQGAIDQAAGLVQIDSTWTQTLHVNRIEE